jgi:hypothetical protein
MKLKKLLKNIKKKLNKKEKWMPEYKELINEFQNKK